MTKLIEAAQSRCIALPCLILIISLLPFNLHADCQVSLTWDPNYPTPDGYRLFQRESGTLYNYQVYSDTGLNTTGTVSGLIDGKIYHFVVRAYVGADESGDSNEATFTCSNNGSGTSTSSTPPVKPILIAPSDNSADVDLEPTLRTSTFVDHDTGDYHARTRWAVYRLGDDVCVLDTTSSTALTRLTIRPSTLSPFTTYYWTVWYFDQNGSMSAPAQTCDFTTQQETAQAQTASLSTSSSTGGSGGGGGLGGCFVGSLVGRR